jgi:hypothetical protein
MIDPQAGPRTAQRMQVSYDVSDQFTSSGQLSISYQNLIAPAILVGIVLSAFMYARSVSQLKFNIAKLSE